MSDTDPIPAETPPPATPQPEIEPSSTPDEVPQPELPGGGAGDPRPFDSL